MAAAVSGLFRQPSQQAAQLNGWGVRPTSVGATISEAGQFHEVQAGRSHGYWQVLPAPSWPGRSRAG